MDENDLCCEQVELHEDAIRTARQALTDPETVAALADLFKVLGDPTRIRILQALHDTRLCVCDIAETLGMTQSAISHQLRVLRQARLVRARREGRSVFYALDDDHVAHMCEQGLLHVSEGWQTRPPGEGNLPSPGAFFVWRQKNARLHAKNTRPSRGRHAIQILEKEGSWDVHTGTT